MPTLQQSTPETNNVSYPFLPESEYIQKSITHVAKFKPHSIVVYKKFEGFDKSKSQNELDNLIKGKNGEYNGFMSPTTSRSVRSLIENWMLALEFNITRGWSITIKEALQNKFIKQQYAPTFVTLTIPCNQIHDDNFIKKNMLWRFIQDMQRQQGVKYYFWRAEPQANGQIHFHLLLDKYIKWQDIRNKWNSILSDYGYIEQYRQNQIAKHKSGFNYDKEQCTFRLLKDYKNSLKSGLNFDAKNEKSKDYKRQLNAYETGIATNWSNPNTTDIHSIMNVKSITAYVVKYVTKSKEQEDNEGINTRKIEGRIWGCSDELRKLKHYETQIAEEIDFKTYDSDVLEIDVVINLERTLPKKDIIRDTEAGILILMLREQKLYEFLKLHHKAVFERYKNHYEFMFISLYRPEFILDFISIVLELSKIGNSFTIGNKVENEIINKNESFFSWEQSEMVFCDVPF